MIKRAKQRDCQMAFFPECFDYIGRNRDETIALGIEEDGQYINQFREVAREHRIWLSLGGFHNKDPSKNCLPFNTYLVLDENGETRSRYDKLHLFNLDLPGRIRLMESEFSTAGTDLVLPVDTPIGKLGTAICYDVRFPELSLWQRYKGAQILSYPAAFTVNTGLAHWETLLRARAIETQCYVVAAAQTGKHNEKRSSYGHSMVVDPWGAVIAQCSETVDMCFAEISLDYLDEVRALQPVLDHRRSDLYSLIANERSESKESVQFGPNTISSDTIFYRSGKSFAFVNLKPVKAGHVLVAPIREVKRLAELTDPETADLFITVTKIQRLLESYYKAEASTVTVQDGPDAGQTVPHVHVHVIPRTPGDFRDNEIYTVLEGHEDVRKPRTEEEMKTEADNYRNFLNR
uniref:Nitrilase and fragile histidine triad fusion protein NitFhit n=1 Tax=Acrobeloides nanus TaxID=290746 RepID=A0A914CTR1_9BILA